MRKFNLTLVAVILAATFTTGMMTSPNGGEGIKNSIILNADNMMSNFDEMLIEKIKIVNKMSEQIKVINRLNDGTLLDEWKQQRIETVLFAEKVFSELPKIEIQEEVVIEDKKEDYEYYEITAYSNHFKSTGKNAGDKDYGITASGKETVEGVTIAADWNKLPVGTVVYIDGVGERTVTDKGGAIKKHKIDLYFEKEEDALEFGRKKKVKVYILEEA